MRQFVDPEDLIFIHHSIKEEDIPPREGWKGEIENKSQENFLSRNAKFTLVFLPEDTYNMHR